ncbi:MAG: hypothetical protein GFH27_549313n59 [Chloroflexi bacterium AL-W]|nr:hypothetical protein [Chloroflexi bacterium AL-N1]NOK69482.1 hypothetical protein [Chloroflexi bacterium AL-N10]NOK77447.1 hypothetical protein [Chloroflexi bacterium AL-N5]NOK84298.1 hypothetical protein [Chloroflexi bacterium AL-W]NOK91536.1 hypothetical protein [Chloroflexi bacterium AL-N15]
MFKDTEIIYVCTGFEGNGKDLWYTTVIMVLRELMDNTSVSHKGCRKTTDEPIPIAVIVPPIFMTFKRVQM